MPWNILPFIVGAFIFVAGLNTLGAVDSLAVLITETASSLGISIAIHGILAFLLANIIVDQPMTILFSNLFVSDGLQISKQAYQGGAYAVIIASNLAANLTIIGALAGLMWKRILQTKGIHISYFDFLKVGAIITPIAFTLSLATLYLVLR